MTLRRLGTGICKCSGMVRYGVSPSTSVGIYSGCRKRAVRRVCVRAPRTFENGVAATISTVSDGESCTTLRAASNISWDFAREGNCLANDRNELIERGGVSVKYTACCNEARYRVDVSCITVFWTEIFYGELRCARLLFIALLCIKVK